ncbi:hypothetical protein V5F59_03880 [Xanthobacter autotrophicus DSM 431]|uniref:hypothetical protein n=1 Tax=Xanthobacter nonsaccharivorans TaxID=3119912 RepID=UPI00372CDA8E
MKRPCLVMAVLLGSIGCASSQEASKATIDANKALLNYLPFTDQTDFQNATRGQIATLEAE